MYSSEDNSKVQNADKECSHERISSVKSEKANSPPEIVSYFY